MKHKFYIFSKDLLLKPFEEQHISNEYIEWLNSPDINRFLEVRFTEWDREACINYVRNAHLIPSKYLFGIYSSNGCEHIGNASIYDINNNHGTFNFGLLIGSKRYWGKGFGVQSTIGLLTLAFDYLFLRKFSGGCYANQLASRMILKSIGAKLEARIPDRFLFEGSCVDYVIYGMDSVQWSTNKQHVIDKFNISIVDKH